MDFKQEVIYKYLILKFDKIDLRIHISFLIGFLYLFLKMSWKNINNLLNICLQIKNIIHDFYLQRDLN